MACRSRNLKENNLLARGCELSDETRSASRLLDSRRDHPQLDVRRANMLSEVSIQAAEIGCLDADLAASPIWRPGDAFVSVRR
jgi:hypothetical protein